jgi:hypothetical protein
MTAQSQANRRLFLAAGSASAVFGALAKAAAGPSPANPVFGLRAQAAYTPTAGDDPIFAAIERHETAEVRYCAACNLTDEVAARNEQRVITAEDHAEFDAAQRNSDEALDVFLATAPTTRAGVRAFLRHCIDQDSVEEFLAEALETLLDSPVLADLEARP